MTSQSSRSFLMRLIAASAASRPASMQAPASGGFLVIRSDIRGNNYIAVGQGIAHIAPVRGFKGLIDGLYYVCGL